MSYLLDTNAVVALLRNKPTNVRERYRQAADRWGVDRALVGRAV